MHKLKQIGVLGTLAAAGLLAGCRQDMQDQPKFVPQRGSSFYADGRSVRPQVEGTVARGQMHEDAYFNTGLSGGKEGDGMPFPVTREVLERGQERYNVYCTPCHSRVGNGEGMIVQRGYRPAGNFHTPRLQAAPLGHFFNVMTNGFGAMPDYAAQLTPADRWAVVAYIKALQLSQNAKPTDVAADAHPETLASIAQREGMPDSFAQNWALPATAIYGTPNNEDNGIPGQPMGAAIVPATPSSAKPSAPPAAAKPATPAQPMAATKAPEANLVATAMPGVLPPGPGKAIVERSCQSCHGLKMITSMHASQAAWHGTVELMISRGAQVSPQEIQTVTRYLAEHFPPLNASSNSPDSMKLPHSSATGSSNTVKQ